jgi:hypothetical protein
VNLAAGKNSTDIALAVDAIDLTLAERPDVVVIASSDSDFAPLVSRLREKGCRVIGVGQQGKTGDETRAVYDDYEVMEHRKAKPQGGSDARAEGRGKGRGDGRGEGRAESRREGRSEGRSGGRERGRAPRKSVESAILPLEALDSLAISEALHEAPSAPSLPSLPETLPPPVKSLSAALPEARPARARSRGGRRKPQAEALSATTPKAEPPPPGPAPAPDLAAEPPGAQVKPARKPRRRRSATAKRPVDNGTGSLP